MIIRLRRDIRGFTLIEVIASLMVFSIVTLGVLPLLASSIRASVRSRNLTVGRNILAEAMEHVRGLPYFVSLRNQRVDVLDFYYPTAAGADADDVYRVTCVPGSTQPACTPFGIPAGYTLRFASRFVSPIPGSVTNDGVPDYALVAPPADYTAEWDGSGAKRLDVPPSDILEMTITASWTIETTPRRFAVTTIVGAKEVARNKINGAARIDYGVRFQTTFDANEFDTNNLVDDLTVTGGSATSVIGARLTSTASQTIDAAEITLVRRPDPGNPASVAVTLPPTPLFGARGARDAPPDGPIPDDGRFIGNLDYSSSAGLQRLIAGGENSTTTNGSVGIAVDQPSATGTFSLQRAGAITPALWAASQFHPEPVPPGHPGGSRWQIDRDAQIAGVSPHPGRGIGGNRFTGTTNAVTGALSVPADRRVETSATLEIDEIDLLPVLGIGDTDYRGYLVLISNFRARVNCKSHPDPIQAVPTVTWTARLDYWNNANYTTISLSGTAGAPQLVPLTGGANPKIIDNTVASGLPDVFLFEEGGRVGYIRGWSSRFSAAADGIQELENGRVTTAELEGAITVNLAPRNTFFPDSGMQVSIGNLSCRAEDLR